MKAIPKIIQYIIIGVLICFAVMFAWSFWFVVNFHGESYSKSERYIINLSADSAISKIKEYKVKYPQHKQFEIDTIDKVIYEFGHFTEIKYDGSANVTTSTRTAKSTWYHCRFYVEKNGATVSCCIKLRQFPAEIQLISVTGGKNKEINNYKEISRKENRKVKKQFETEILDKIYADKWKHKHWYN